MNKTYSMPSEVLHRFIRSTNMTKEKIITFSDLDYFLKNSHGLEIISGKQVNEHATLCNIVDKHKFANFMLKFG